MSLPLVSGSCYTIGSPKGLNLTHGTSQSVDWNQETVSGFDAVFIATNHANVSYIDLARWAPCIIDTRNAMANVETKPGQVWKA